MVNVTNTCKTLKTFVYKPMQRFIEQPRLTNISLEGIHYNPTNNAVLNKNTLAEIEQINGFSAQQSLLVTKPKISLRQRIGNWFENLSMKLVAPAGNVEILKTMQPEQFEKIKMLETLTKAEKETLRRELLSSSDITDFFLTISSKKPSCLLAGNQRDVSFLQKIKQNKLYSDKFDVLSFKLDTSSEAPITYILNKEKVIETINRNKSIYTTRMNLPQNTSVEEIYKELLNNKFLNPRLASGNTDLVGLTLGYPKLSTMMFRLENNVSSEIPITKIRKDSKKYRKLLLDALYNEKSPYKNLPANEFEELKKAIETYKYKKPSFDSRYYTCTELASEPSETKRIKEAIESFKKEFTKGSII